MINILFSAHEALWPQYQHVLEAEFAKQRLEVNLVQDTDAPTMFINENEVGRLKENSLIIDVSCDEGMGFFGAKPTTFENPMFRIGHAHYYAVDHTPSYLWKKQDGNIVIIKKH